MYKLLIALVIILGAGGLFFYSQKAEAPTMPAPLVEESPFGEGANKIGELMPPPVDPSVPVVTPNPGAQTPISTDKEPSSGVTRAELAKHTTQQDCWVAYKGVVYDITTWLPRHPGSAASIAPYCGKAEEFTAAFSRQHGTSREGRLKREGVDKGAFTE